MKRDVRNPRTRYDTCVRLAGAALALALLVGCGQGAAATDHYERASAYYAEDNPRAAIIELRNALQAEPDHVDARALLGRVYVATEDMAAAEKELSRALDRGAPPQALLVDLGIALFGLERHEELLERVNAEPDWPAATQARIEALRGRAHVARGESARARAALDRAEALSSGELQTHLGHIELAIARGQVNSARRAVARALDEHRESPHVWRHRATVELAANDAGAAEAAIDRAIELGAQRASDRLLRARLAIARGDAAAARDDLDTLGRRVTRTPQYLFTEGLVLAVEGDEAGACDQFRRAVADAPEYVEARYQLGACHYRAGELNQAASHLRWVNQRSPSPQAARLLAATQYALDDHERARRTLHPIVQQYPHDAEARALLARIEIALGNDEAGVVHLERLALLRPDDPAIQLELGAGQLRSGDGPASERLAEALALDPELDEAAELLIVSLVRSGELERAVAEAEALAERRPERALPLNLAALVHFARDDGAAARAALERAIEREPGDPVARHNLARLALVEADTASARTHYEAVLAVDPEHVDTLVALAEAEAASGASERAAALLEQARAVGTAPESARARRALADHHLAAGEPAAALAVVTEADGRIAMQPALRERAARAQLALEQPEAATELLEPLLQAEPARAQAHLLLARAYTHLGRHDDALVQLDRLLTHEPDHSQALMLQARARVRLGDDADAQALLNRLGPDFEDHPFVLESRGMLVERAGDHATGADYYARAHDMAPSESLARALGRTLARTDRTEAAVTVLADWHADNPAGAGLLQEMGDLYTELGQEEDAIAAYRAALAVDPQALRALNNLAWHLRERDSAEAVALARQALERAPDSAAIRDTLGVALLYNGDIDTAIAELRAASEQAPEAPALGYHLARALAADEQYEAARAELRRVLASEATFGEREAAEKLLAELEASS